MMSYIRDAAGFVQVAPAREIAPGAGRTVEVAGWWLALFNVDGAFYAIDNACPHNGGPLGVGRLDGTIVSCPLHAWEFDVTTGVCPGNEHIRVGRFETKVEDAWVWVRLFAPARNADCSAQQ